VWNDLMAAAITESTPEPLNAEEILMLAEQTLKEAADKPIVIADEPTAFLTPELTMRMLDLLRKQAEAGKTVLVTTRKPQVAEYAKQVINL
jgi:ABC-type lipoprotein export system ATPase subunit